MYHQFKTLNKIKKNHNNNITKIIIIIIIYIYIYIENRKYGELFETQKNYRKRPLNSSKKPKPA